MDRPSDTQHKALWRERHLHHPPVSLNISVYFVLIWESRNAVQDISVLGICNLVAELSSGPREMFFKATEKIRAGKMCAYCQLSPHYLHKSSCWNRLSCPDSGSRATLLGMMTETTWEPQGYDPWRPGRNTKWCVVISPFTMTRWFPGVFSSFWVVAQATRCVWRGALWEQDMAKEYFLVFHFEGRTMHIWQCVN
jgi:hypothetical protein